MEFIEAIKEIKPEHLVFFDEVIIKSFAELVCFDESMHRNSELVVIDRPTKKIAELVFFDRSNPQAKY